MSPRRAAGGSAATLLLLVACSGSSASAPPGGGGPSTDAAASDATAPAVDGSQPQGDDASAVTDATSVPDATAGCGEFAGDASFTCAKDGNSRGRCVGDASLDVEPCPNGCLRMPAGQDSVCMGTTTTWTCTGSYGTTRAQDGNYYLTSFGCWIDADGGAHTDPADNCIPGCLSKAQSAGLCAATDTGPQCENGVDWFVADSGRFGCLQRLRVTNPANGKTVIAVALDAGPACTGEAKVQHAVLDASGRIDDYLFGGAQGTSDHALVHVVEVDDATPLGPVP